MTTTSVSKVEMRNVVGHLDFNREFDLKSVEELLSSNSAVLRTCYAPEQYHWLQTWFQSPFSNGNRYVSFYRSGTAMITGCASVSEFDAIADLVESVMEPVVENGIRREVKNMVATGDVGVKVDLSMKAIQLGLNTVEYEPEQFPCLIYRDQNRGCVFLLFGSGKIICTGLTETEDVENAIKGFQQKLVKLAA